MVSFKIHESGSKQKREVNEYTNGSRVIGRRCYLCWQCINKEREEPVEGYHSDINAVSIKMTTKHRKLLRHQVFENKLEYKRGKFECITTTCVKCFWW